MPFDHDYIAVKNIEIDWFRECFVGLALSTAFTIVATFSEAETPAPTGMAERIHDFLVLGGTTMLLICGIAAVVVALYRSLNGGDAGKSSLLPSKKFRLFPASSLQAAKFIKIFLP